MRISDGSSDVCSADLHADVVLCGLLQVAVAADSADGEADPLVGVDGGGDERGVLVAVGLDHGAGAVGAAGDGVGDGVFGHRAFLRSSAERGRGKVGVRKSEFLWMSGK